MVKFLIVIIYNIHMQQVYKWVLSAVTLASILIALRLLVDRNLLVCGEYIYGSTLHTMKKTSLILTEGAQVEILVPCNSSNPCLPSSMLVMLIITTRNIHFYDENLNDESETVIEDRYL